MRRRGIHGLTAEDHARLYAWAKAKVAESLPDPYDPRRPDEMRHLLATRGSNPLIGIAARRYLRHGRNPLYPYHSRLAQMWGF